MLRPPGLSRLGQIGWKPIPTFLPRSRVLIRRHSTSPPGPDNRLSPSSRLSKIYPSLVRLSTRTGVPIPSLFISFLVLHEITAFVPLIILFYVFQGLGLGVGLVSYIQDLAGTESSDAASTIGTGDVIPGRKTGNGMEDGSTSEEAVREGWKGIVKGWYEEAEKRTEKVGRRYGIFGFPKSPPRIVGDSSAESPAGEIIQISEKDQNAGVVGPTVASAIASYVVIKALLPVRIAASVALAPPFARFALNPIQMLYARVRKQR